MRDAIVMWRNPRMVVLTAVCAAVYAAAMIPFKFLVIFPGLAEVRPAAVFPVVFSFLFGPAAAFGAAFGNVVGDMLGGMLGPGSIIGFFANFAYGYVPYKMWEALAGDRDPAEELSGWREKTPLKSPSLRAAALVSAAALLLGAGAVIAGELKGEFSLKEWLSDSGVALSAGEPVLLAVFLTLSLGGFLGLAALVYPIRFIASVFFSCLACAGILGWGVSVLGFFPFKVFGTWILVNNLSVSLALAGPLLVLFAPWVRGRFMSYKDLLGEQRSTSRFSRLGILVFAVGCVCLFIIGVSLEGVLGGGMVLHGLYLLFLGLLFFGLALV